MTKIEPRYDNVLVKVDGESSNISKFGIITPENAKEEEKKSVGEVLGVGSEVKDIKKGDRVIFGTFAGDEVELDGESFTLVDQKHILAFIN